MDRTGSGEYGRGSQGSDGAPSHRNETNIKEGRGQILEVIERGLVAANEGNRNVDKDIAVVVLSFADICSGFDTGLLFFESTFLSKLDSKDRAECNEWLWGNWKVKSIYR